jgi:molybdopterin adenylyltransferase
VTDAGTHDAEAVVPGALPIGIVTVSDRASTGVYEDLSGPAIEAACRAWLATPWQPARRLVPDEQPAIEAALRELVDVVGCPLVVTTGGTGPAPRDVTPEATAAVCDRLLPGFGELMRAVSVRTVPTAILSRQVAGTRGTTLIVNLPGKPAAIVECLGAVWPSVLPCIRLLGGPRLASTAQAPTGLPPVPLSHSTP